MVVDPLTSTAFTVLFGGANAIMQVRLERDDASTSSNVMLAFERVASMTDVDCYAYLMNDDFSSPAMVFRETATAMTRHFVPCFCAQARIAMLVSSVPLSLTTASG